MTAPVMSRAVTGDDVRRIVQTRVRHPEQIADAFVQRKQPEGLVGETGRLMLIAADHPARGALRAGADAFAMGDRTVLLDRLVRALARPGVDGFLGTADVVEDLLLLGALEGKVVIGSMNRGGLAGTTFEMDDRFTAYDAAAVERAGLQGGKMLLRIDPADAGSVATMQACAQAIDTLAARGLMAMIEPFISGRDEQGRVHNDLSTDAVVRSATVSAGLATTSAHTWLKLPVTDDPTGMAAVLSASTLPVLLLGGEVGPDQDVQRASWREALAHPTACGMVVGRSLLFPPDGDVESAVDATVALL